MASPKASTIQQRFGFKDNDLKKPKHDEIMYWLNDAIVNFPDIILNEPQEWTREDMLVIGEDKDKIFEFEIFGKRSVKLPQKSPTEILSVQWEKTITCQVGSNKQVVGFVDLYVLSKRCRNLRYNVDIEDFSYHEYEHATYFEIKTEIPSLGEVIRQINMYKTYIIGDSDWKIVSPDDGHRNMLLSQGIGFIKYEPNRFNPDEVEMPDGSIVRIQPH